MPAPIAFPDLDTGQISSVQFSPDGRRLAFGYGADAEVTMWNLETGRVAWQRHIDGTSGGLLAFDSSGRFLAVQGYDPDHSVPLSICTLSGYLERQLEDQNWGETALIENSGRFLVTKGKWHQQKNGMCVEEPITKVWSTRTWRLIDSLQRKTEFPVLLTASGHIIRHPKRSSETPGLLKDSTPAEWWNHVPKPPYSDEHFVNGGHYFIRLSGDRSTQGLIEVWDMREKKMCCTATMRNDSPLTATISPDGKTLAVGSFGGTVEFRDFPTGKLVVRSHCSDDLIRCLTYSPNGRVLAAAGGEPTGGGGIRLLDTKSHTLLAVLKAAFPEDSYTEKDWTLDHPDWFAALPDLSYLASNSVVKKIRMPGCKRDARFIKQFARPQRIRAALRRCYR